MEAMTDTTWPACPNLDEFINNSNGSSSPLIFEPCDSSSPSMTSIDTESEGDKEVLWNCTNFSTMPFLEMDDWLENMPFDSVSSLSPCTTVCGNSLTSSGDNKLAPSSVVSSAICTSDPIKRQEYVCASLDHNLYNESLLQDPTSDANLDTGCPSSCSASWIGSDCSQTMRIDSNFWLNSGENVNEQQNVPNTTQTYPDLSKIIVKKPILDKAVEQLGGGKKGAQMLWQLIRLWLAQRDIPVNERLVSLKHVQDPVDFSKPEEFDLHSTLEAMGEKGLEDSVFFPRMEGMPDLDKKHVAQWMFQEGWDKSETSPLNSLFPCCISKNSMSVIQQNGKIDHHAAWPPISSQFTVDGVSFASYGAGPFSGDVSEDAHVIDGSEHLQTRNGLNVNPVSLEPPSLVSTSIAPGLSCAAQNLNSRIFEQALNFSQYNRIHTEPCNLGGLVNFHLGTGSALQSETSLENFTMGDSTNPGLRTPAATSRAARKSRMARQRRFMTNHYGRLTVPSASSVSWSSLLSSGGYRNISTGSKTESLGRSSFLEGKVRNSEQNLKLLLQKELKPSDVGNLGRIVLPKKEAEIHLPYLTAREGVAIPMEDMKTTQIWNFRYRYWPNNKSRMYLLESTGNF
ncbi:hypothetical protein O6H91_10G069900 [Diphasiastrum complanatum]|nr:hypothetical protein O6H91_10G069900 [Diphasiastrum complanatum]